MTTKRPSYRLKRMETHKRTNYNPLGASAPSFLRTPIVRIEDHKAPVLSCDFHPSGKFLLSTNTNGEILICDIYGSFTKAMVLQGHGGPVMQAEFSRDGFNVYSGAADGTVSVWDTFKGYRKARLEGHTSSANCVNGARIGYPVICSGSNDGTVRIWDERERQCAMTLNSGSEVTATCFSEKADFVISGGNDNDIKIWELKTREIVCTLQGHTGQVTGMSLSPCGSYLLSHSVDNSLRVWDIRPNVTFKRCVGTFNSYQHPGDGLLRCTWSPDGTKISAGTSDRDVFIWDAMTGDKLHELSGHEGTINETRFHPKESVILSVSNDHYVFLHEI